MTKKLAVLTILSALTLSAQVVGTIQATPGAPPAPAQPAKIVATAGAVSCSVTGDTFPAKALIIACTVNSVVLPSYTMPLAPGTAYTFQHNFGFDGVSLLCKADDKSAITVQVAAGGPSQGLAF